MPSRRYSLLSYIIQKHNRKFRFLTFFTFLLNCFRWFAACLVAFLQTQCPRPHICLGLAFRPSSFAVSAFLCKNEKRKSFSNHSLNRLRLLEQIYLGKEFYRTKIVYFRIKCRSVVCRNEKLSFRGKIGTFILFSTI